MTLDVSTQKSVYFRKTFSSAYSIIAQVIKLTFSNSNANDTIDWFDSLFVRNSCLIIILNTVTYSLFWKQISNWLFKYNRIMHFVSQQSNTNHMQFIRSNNIFHWLSFRKQRNQKFVNRKFTQMTKSINYHWFCCLKFVFVFTVL